jgi:DNA replication licensing factor MCM7
MRSYIAYAQTFLPTIPSDLHNYIVARYVEKRKFQKEGNISTSYTYVTPRTLLAIIRIGQAMAKFNFRSQVVQQDIDSAIKLMDFSFRTLESIHNENAGAGRRQDGK